MPSTWDDAKVAPKSGPTVQLPWSRVGAPGSGRPTEKALVASGFLALRLDVLNLGSVTGVLQHAAQVDNLLRVDVLVVEAFERLGLSSEGHKEPTGTVLLDRSHSIQ